MKYKEFKAKIKDWGKNYNYNPVIEVDCEFIKLKNNDYIICLIYKSERFVLDLSWASYRHFSDDAKQDLFKIITEFATTPIEDREDKEREDNKTFDLIIHTLKVMQSNAEDVMNWTIEEIHERSWYLRSTLEDIIIDLEEYKEERGI